VGEYAVYLLVEPLSLFFLGKSWFQGCRCVFFFFFFVDVQCVVSRRVFLVISV
jgi:hypothetical protein